MKLQKATVFALYAVLELAAAPGRQRTVVEIAEKYGISAHHLAKVLRDLGRAGIVDAVRGVGGGYRFTGNAKRLTLMDVIRLSEEPSADADLPLPSRDAQTGATLRSISLSTMLKRIARRPWESQGAATPAPRAQAGRRSR